MSEHRTHTMDRHCDVAIVGGSAAGLGAALQIGRQRRSVIVIDSGEPRNAPAAHVHGYPGHEGVAPADLAAIARAEVRSYGVEVLDGRVLDVLPTNDGRFRLELVGGHSVTARRVLAATGLVDELPDIDGLAEHWGGDVIHCPFCHGYEARDRRIVQIVTHPMALHPAGLFRQLTDRLTLVLHDGVDVDDPGLDTLRAAGVDVVDDRVARVVTGAAGHVEAVELSGGGRLAADAIAIGSVFRVRADALASVGVETSPHPTGLGDVVEVGPDGATSVPGVYAAGNITDPSQQVLQAAANGSRVGAMICFGLANDDIEAAARPSSNEADWDHRYSGDQMWSGAPNATLVAEVTGIEPGRALDVGAGEGGDALWLAEQGWEVTASDVSKRALDHVARVADERGVRIEGLHADANARKAFVVGGFDLVTAHYASIPRTPDGRAVTNVLDAVAPGGTLLVVSHDVDAMRATIDTHQHTRPFDPDAYVSVDHFVEALTDSTDWTIGVHEKRPRSSEHAAASHHVDDIVLRTRRHLA